MELVRLDYGPMCRNDSCMYGCKVAFLMYILIPFCRKCGWLCIFHEEFCEKDKFAYHIVDILRNLLFFMVYLLWTVFIAMLPYRHIPNTPSTYQQTTPHRCTTLCMQQYTTQWELIFRLIRCTQTTKKCIWYS